MLAYSIEKQTKRVLKDQTSKEDIRIAFRVSVKVHRSRLTWKLRIAEYFIMKRKNMNSWSNLQKDEHVRPAAAISDENLSQAHIDAASW
jgi:hypothetical protein